LKANQENGYNEKLVSVDEYKPLNTDVEVAGKYCSIIAIGDQIFLGM